jgi:dTDP-4-dehydrorhamnose reductase
VAWDEAVADRRVTSAAADPLPFEVWASPEATVARLGERIYRDQLAETGHDVRDRDLDLLAGLGVAASRYPVLWERTAPQRPQDVDLAWAARRLGGLGARGIEPIVTLLHHGGGPPYTSLVDPAFPELFARYASAVAAAFPWVRRWTPINEPLTTARFSGLYGVWYPHATDDASFGRAIVNQALGILLAMEAIEAHAPRAELVITEDLQSFTALDRAVRDYAEHKRERAYLSIELLMGRVRPGHALYRYLLDAAGVPRELLERVERHARPPDLVGWNYYPHSERALGARADGSFFNAAAFEHGKPFAPRELLRAAHERLRLPFGLGEVHRSGSENQRVAWLDDRADDLMALSAEGRPVRMLGAWAAFGLVDWDSLLRERRDHREDGVFSFAGRGEVPRETAVASAVRALATRGSVPAG